MGWAGHLIGPIVVVVWRLLQLHALATNLHQALPFSHTLRGTNQINQGIDKAEAEFVCQMLLPASYSSFSAWHPLALSLSRDPCLSSG